MKTLKFYKHLVGLVLDGSKTITWRLFDDKNLSDGDHCIFINKNTGEEFAQATLIKVQTKTLKELTEKDFDGHESMGTDEEMYTEFSKWYSKSVNKDTEVKIIHFKIEK